MKLDYIEFAENCVNEIKSLQDELISDFSLGSYDNWYYDQATGLLTFSTKDEELNFKYFSVGTFSNNTNTWKWSWDNEHTLDNVKLKSLNVKEFGETNNYDKLTNGYFESNEEEAWEFTAISAKVTNSIGIYRAVDEHLLIFLALTEVVDNETAQKLKDKFVSCSVHEKGRVAFVCKHLNKETKVGFEESFETFEDMELYEDDDFQAWCSECEIVRQKTDGWNDESMAFANIKVVCEKCYFEMKAVNV